MLLPNLALMTANGTLSAYVHLFVGHRSPFMSTCGTLPVGHLVTVSKHCICSAAISGNIPKRGDYGSNGGQRVVLA